MRADSKTGAMRFVSGGRNGAKTVTMAYQISKSQQLNNFQGLATPKETELS